MDTFTQHLHSNPVPIASEHMYVFEKQFDLPKGIQFERIWLILSITNGQLIDGIVLNVAVNHSATLLSYSYIILN